MRRLIPAVILLGTVLGALYFLPSRISDYPPVGLLPASSGTDAAWTRLLDVPARVVVTCPDSGQAYLMEDGEDRETLRCLTWEGNPAAVTITSVEPQSHSLTVSSPVPAFGVGQDTLPLRSLRTPDGVFFYLRPEGIPREISLAPDGRFLALTDRGHNALWIAGTGDLLPVQATANRIAGYDKAQLLAAGNTKDTEGWSLVWAASPVWSPAGITLFYLSNRATGGTDLWSLDRGTGQEVRLVAHGETGFIGILGWVGETELLLRTGAGSILSYAPAGNTTRTVLTLSHPVSLAPGGNILLYQQINRRTAVVDPELLAIVPATGQTLPLPSLPASFRNHAQGEWCPDGDRFAFYADNRQTPGDTRLAVLSFLPGGEPRLTLYPPPEANLSFDPSRPPGWLTAAILVCVLRAGRDQPAPVATWLLDLTEGGGQ